MFETKFIKSYMLNWNNISYLLLWITVESEKQNILYFNEHTERNRTSLIVNYLNIFRTFEIKNKKKKSCNEVKLQAHKAKV